ncbi:hypothetical protein BGX34_002909 [Mortierella sp. NVP85]|nr:hypothetical protein BGX34_002909 [Mortierella sp. NVP85]
MSEHDDDHHAESQEPALSPRPQQLQQQQQRQRLPNELLYYIIDRWCSQDFFILHSLLCVNKLFFYTAAPHLWSNPFEKWDMNYHLNEIGFIPDREGLMATMFASLFETMLLKQEQREREKDQEQGQEQDESAHGSRKIVQRKSDAQRVDDMLKPFGLRVAKGVQSPFLRYYLRDKHRDHSSNPGENNSDGSQVTESHAGQGPTIQTNETPTQRTKMMANYSKYFGSLCMDDWRFLDFDQLIQLRFVPPEDRTIFFPPMASDDDPIDDNEDDEADYVDVQEHQYQLKIAIASLLLFYNFENITDMTLDMELAPKCLVLAPKMSRLREVFLQRSEALPDIHLQSMILFIRRNMEAFPRKPPLNLGFDYGWSLYEQNFDSFFPPATDHSETSNLANETAAIVHIRRERSFQYDFMKPKITLWEAVGSPREISVTMVPLFYEHAQKIQLDRLEKFSDEDVDRLDQGEGPGMRTFLKKCHRLQELCVRVGNKDFFSWAAEEALVAAGYPISILSELQSESVAGDGARLSYPVHDELSSLPMSKLSLSGRPRSSGILPNLETLDLFSDSPYRFIIYALNDAMVACAGSLRNIRVHGCPDMRTPDGWHPESILARRRARLAMPLYHVPWANTICGGADFLPFLLPRLKSFDVRLRQIASVQIGSLSQCPNLEHLSLWFGGVAITEMHPDDQALQQSVSLSSSAAPSPASIGSENPASPISQQARVDRSLFPVWNLPRLQTLALEDLAALRFDFESLQSMKCLEKLELRVGKKIPTWYLTGEYVEIQKRAWKKKYDTFSNREGSHDDDNNREIHPGDETGLPHKGRNRPELWRWSLPNLKSLILHGPPAEMFFLEWLKECPKLEDLTLTTLDSNQHITRLPYYSPLLSDHTDGDRSQDSLDSEAINEHPLLYSQLKSASFAGYWNMSAEDLLALLTIYAPFLEKLSIDRLHGRSSLNACRLVETIMEADEINQAYVESMLAPDQDEDECDVDHEGVTDDKIQRATSSSDSGLETQSTSNPSTLMDSSDHAPAGQGEQSRLSMIGAHLKTVSAKMTLNKRSKMSLGLVAIGYDEISKYQAQKLRVYILTNQNLVTREDHRMMKAIEKLGEVEHDNQTESC